MKSKLLFRESEKKSSATKKKVATKRKAKSNDGGIRCPHCKWQPPRSARWGCSCGHVWNTFETRGVCPSCERRWKDTQCLKCNEWSKHADWYYPPGE